MEIAEIINKINLKGKDKLIAFLEKIQEFNKKEYDIRNSNLDYEEETNILQNEIYPEKNKIFNEMMREVINGNIEIINPDNSDTFFENANHCNIQVFCSTNYMGIELYIPNEDEPGYFTQAYKFVCPVNELDEDIREDIAFRFSNALQGINKEEMLNELTNIILESDKVLDEEYPYIKIDELRPHCYEDKMEQYDNINITLYKENDSSFSIKVQFNEFVEEEFDDDGEYYYDTYYRSEHSPYIKFTDEQQKMLEAKYEKQTKKINQISHCAISTEILADTEPKKVNIDKKYDDPLL